jgi:tyrosyl-DNA phosphodiesterase-1
MAVQDDNPPAKRRKLDANLPEEALATSEYQIQKSAQKGLDRPISPPLSRRKSPIVPNTLFAPTWDFDDVPKHTAAFGSSATHSKQNATTQGDDLAKGSTNYVPSPFQLTYIEDLSPHQNADAVRLKDILGDPMIKECWNFNFLFDIDFVM